MTPPVVIMLEGTNAKSFRHRAPCIAPAPAAKVNNSDTTRPKEAKCHQVRLGDADRAKRPICCHGRLRLPVRNLGSLGGGGCSRCVATHASFTTRFMAECTPPFMRDNSCMLVVHAHMPVTLTNALPNPQITARSSESMSTMPATMSLPVLDCGTLGATGEGPALDWVKCMGLAGAGLASTAPPPSSEPDGAPKCERRFRGS